MKALLIPAAAVALLAGCVGYGDPVGYGYGGPVTSSGYAYPAYQQTYPYGTYGAYSAYPYNTYPAPIARSLPRSRDIDGDGVRNRVDRDRDGDGVRNRVDRDRDGDGVPNVNDAHPNNPARR
jgi:hypothetical protein